MNIFEKASINKTRYPSVRGELTTEQLWDIPLTSSTGFDLDSIARGVNSQLKELAEESFVKTSSNPSKAKFEHMLEVIKYVIDFKLQAAEENANRRKKAEEKAKLLEILERKQNESLEKLDETAIQKRLAELG
jgi:hypothetical protein